MLLNSLLIITSVKEAYTLWLNILCPSLFPFFIFSNILVNYGFIEISSEILKPLTNFLKLNKNSSFVLLMSMISGIPSNAKYIDILLDKKLINTKDATKLLMFTHFNNPLFIIFTVGITFLNSIKLGIIILLTQYLTNFIIALILKDKSIRKETIDIQTIDNKIKQNNNLGLIIKDATIDSINTLLLILGIITIFKILSAVILSKINVPIIYKAILCGVFEITQGLKSISTLNLSPQLKAFLMNILLSFGGLSTHMQIMSILSQKKIRYKSYLLSRLLHISISTIIFLILAYVYFN